MKPGCETSNLKFFYLVMREKLQYECSQKESGISRIGANEDNRYLDNNCNSSINSSNAGISRLIQ
jgi:hypothetical protein